MEDMTLDAIKTRRRAITQGAWVHKPGSDAIVSSLSSSPMRFADYALIAVVNESTPEALDNMLFIAHAPTDIDWLIAQLESAKGGV